MRLNAACRRATGRTAVAVAIALLVAGGVLIDAGHGDARPPPGAALGGAVPSLAGGAGPRTRTIAPYQGLGAWVDGFDYGVAYQRDGVAPPITPEVVDDLAEHGVRTLFLQAAREDTRTPGGIVDPATTATILLRAHRRGIAVVAWYLPRFRDPARDLANLARLDSFNVLGHRFDGIAIDIEFTDDVPDTGARNALLIDLSERFRTETKGDVLGAIVLPPVQTEVINPNLWPEFPWARLAALYDVWLPMSYWTFRSEESGYADGYSYNEESTRRLRADLGDERAPVHGIGGIGDLMTSASMDGFARSLVATQSIGGSIYDWASMTPAARDELAKLFARGGKAAALPPG
ncbi:MAG: hypothetical protein ACR2LQ_07205 [Acidimicrobiales bacterium]